MAQDEIGHNEGPSKTSEMIEGPAGFCNFTPGSARTMPTWHAPNSGHLASQGAPVSIEGPAAPGYPQLPTTKGKAE